MLKILVLTALLANLGSVFGKAPRIGIIGGGIGGSSAAYFLQELLPNAEIEIFEKSRIIGGRLNVTTIFGNGYETGGSIIHPKNKYAVDFAEKFGFEKHTSPGESLSIVKGDEFIFNTSRWTIITIIKTLARYGFEFNKLEKMITGFIDKFSRIYDFQKEGKAFKTPEEMLEAMDPVLLNLTKSDFRTLLKEEGFADHFVNELIQAITFVNYGQDLGIHSFVGSVASAGAGEELWNVWKGNKQIPEQLVNHSKALVHFSTEVTELVRLQDDRYLLLDGLRELGTFDHIVIATPLEANSDSNSNGPILFKGFSSSPYTYDKTRKFHRTVTTFVAGWTHDKYKDRSAILSCVPNWYTSISWVHPTVLVVAEKYPVYKIFSPKPLTEKQLDLIFAERHLVEIHDWLAYPEYDQVPPHLPPFVLGRGLYYLNAIEWAASAMEMSLISGKNIALLIAKEEEQKQNAV